MKSKIIIAMLALLVLFHTEKLKASSCIYNIKNTDTTITDSIGYLNEIVANKQKYINKQLSVLLNDLKLQAKFYFLSSRSKKRKANSIYIWFDSIPLLGNTTKALIIVWTSPLSIDDEISETFVGYQGKWTDSVQKYFGKQVVKDISSWDNHNP
ncbi:MAG TPA: hypothetical protein VHB70_11345 [Parafilimonas sp.]|nr:hypothetical protein [Parafilimonas sp.]